MVPYWPTSGFQCNLPPLDFHSWGIPMYHSYYARKALKCPIWNIMLNLPSNQLRSSRPKSHLSATRYILRSPSKTTLPYREVLMTFGTVKCTSWVQCSEIDSRRIQNKSPVSFNLWRLQGLGMAYLSSYFQTKSLLQTFLRQVLYPNNM